ncbi:MAG: O-antigen ligase family protein [Vicinamibacteria bacterium]|jgi:hypothetical protein|nr:O-antigen ligase family protein [Vicinamibacteria bacterium]
MMMRLAQLLFSCGLVLLPWATWPPFPWIHPHAQWSDVCLILACAAWIVARLRARGPRMWRPVPLLLAAAWIWMLLSLVFSQAPAEKGVAKLSGSALLLIYFGMTSALSSPASRLIHAFAPALAISHLAMSGAALAGVLLSILGLATPYVGGFGDLVPGTYARAQAGLIHPNLLASYCLFAWGLTARTRSCLTPRMFRAVRVALALAALCTFSRALLGLSVAILIGRATTPRRHMVAALAAVTAILASMWLTFFNLQLDPSRPWAAHLAETASPRQEAFQTAFATLAQAPLFGIGPGLSPARVAGFPFDAHCTPLNIAATSGLPVLLLLTAALWVLWRRRGRPTDRILWGALAGLGIDALSQDSEDFRHVWVLLGWLDAESEQNVQAE